MKVLWSNFSDDGLARIFGVDLDATRAPAHTAHKRNAIIAGTVCGVVGLALLVALAAYAAWNWRKTHTHPEEPMHEKDVYPDVHEEEIVERFELQSDSMREPPR